MAVRIRTRSRTPVPSSEVGYGKPPVHTRFQPGQSGNPNGRHGKKLKIDGILEKSLRKRVAITRDGKRKSIALLEAIVEKLTVDAAKGDHAARKLILQLNEQREQAVDQLEQATQGEHAPLEAADEQILEDFRREILEEAAAAAPQPSKAATTTKKEK